MYLLGGFSLIMYLLGGLIHQRNAICLPGQIAFLAVKGLKDSHFYDKIKIEIEFDKSGFAKENTYEIQRNAYCC